MARLVSATWDEAVTLSDTTLVGFALNTRWNTSARKCEYSDDVDRYCDEQKRMAVWYQQPW